MPTQLGYFFFFQFSYLSGVRTDYLAPCLYLTDLLITTLIILNFKLILKKIRIKPYLFILIFLILNITFSIAPFISLYRSLKIIEMLFFYLIIKELRISPIFTLFLFFTSSFTQLVIAIFQMKEQQSLQGIFYWFGERYHSISTPGIATVTLQGVNILRPYGTFSHPNSLAGFYLFLYFFLMIIQFSNKKLDHIEQQLFVNPFHYFSQFVKQTSKDHIIFLFLKYGTMLICMLLIFLSFSKIAIGTFVVLNVVALWKTRKEIPCKVCITSRFLILITMALVFTSAQGDRATINKRVELAKHTITVITSHPLVGSGLGTNVLALSKFDSIHPNFFGQPVHNIILLWISDAGILGIVILGWILFAMKEKLFVMTKSPHLYLILVVLISGFFDHYWYTLQQNMLIITILFGIAKKY